ncbi:pentapeptide repeat-containing protein [Lipingzhangella halophila]|uniref:pentapeptide repeat-containing protein n=1 Tax=Lipingzhangella halophila TaxID=1783352 RepID=UPI0028AC4467|nr:pentapeptide repeat-containing protein [Lipingzhangella halophila]
MLVVPVVVVVLWALLGPVARWAAGPVVLDLPGKDQAAAMNAVRQTLLQAAGGTAALSALVFTATNYLLNRRGQFTDRYTAAIAQLASEKMEERIGGIYALEHLMRESERDHSTVVEVLASFVRENAPALEERAISADRGRWMHPPIGTEDEPEDTAQDRPATDIQAALTVLARRPKRVEPNPVDLRRTNLRGADLRGAQLDHASLNGAQLNDAFLEGAQFNRASLDAAQLNDALLVDAQLDHALLNGAQLNDALLGDAQLNGADLMGAQFNRASLDAAQFNHALLHRAQFNRASLNGAQLNDAFLGGAQLKDAELTEANLTNVIWTPSTLWPSRDLADRIRVRSEEVESGVWRVTGEVGPARPTEGTV